MSRRPAHVQDPSPSPAPSSSSKLNPSSLGLHNKTSRRQNRQSLTTSWIAAQEEQSTSSEAAATEQEFLTPTVTLTQPRESNEEVSKVLIPGQKQSGSSGRRRHALSSPPLSSSSQESRKHSGWRGRLSATVIVDEPILEDEDEEREEEEEKEEGGIGGAEVGDESQPPTPKVSQHSSGSSWSRARAQSYPSHQRQHSSPQHMLLLPRSPLEADREGERVGEREREGERKGERERERKGERKRDVEEKGEGDGRRNEEDIARNKSEGSGGQQPPGAMFKFVQMAVMAKKWKMRSSNEESRPNTQNSREMLCSRQKRRPLVEMPRVLQLELLEEAHHIVHKTLQMYRSELGLRHKLTLKAEQHCETLAQQLNPSTN